MEIVGKIWEHFLLRVLLLRTLCSQSKQISFFQLPSISQSHTDHCSPPGCPVAELCHSCESCSHRSSDRSWLVSMLLTFAHIFQLLCDRSSRGELPVAGEDLRHTVSDGSFTIGVMTGDVSPVVMFFVQK